MASTQLSRVTGTVLAVPAPRSGISRRTQEPYTIETANILVAQQNVTVVQLPRRDDFGKFTGTDKREFVVGQRVDFLIETSVYGNDVQARVLGDWVPDEVDRATGELLSDLANS